MHRSKTVFALGIIFIAAVLSFASCGARKGPGSIDRPGSDLVDYYGCPNSKRVKKLNLRKK